MDRLGKEVVQELVQPLLADLAGQLRLGPGDEYAQPRPRVDDPFPLQFRVDPRHRIGVDDQCPRQVAHRGQAVVRPQPPAGHGLAELAGQLPVDGQAAGGVDLELHRRLE